MRPTASLVFASFLWAAALPAQPECPAGNLLHGRTPIAVSAVAGDPARLTDNFVAPEGAAWNGPQAINPESGAAALTWDLSRPVLLRHFVAQADGDDFYEVSASLDGRSFAQVWQIEPVPGGGLRRRSASLPGVEARFLRIGGARGDGFFAVAELQAFCQLPAPFPPAIPEFGPAAAKTPGNQKLPFWTDTTGARWELILALLGLALLIWRWLRPGLLGARASRPHSRLAPLLEDAVETSAHPVFKASSSLPGAQRWQDRALFALGVLAFCTYFNFGAFHFPKFIHDWEWTHYYLGAKYFDELDYDKLYECIAIADSEAGLQKRVAARKLTNLRTNVLESTADILAHPERCKNEFSAERWRDFRHDVGFFRERQTSSRWEELQMDHGFNATPVWNIAGSLLANSAPAGKTQLYLLAALDPLYLLLLTAAIVWAFGWRTAAVALLVLATNFPSRFYWTGGSFLRWDWLFFTIAAICCLRKERPFLAGLALGYAALLRIFPLLIFAGPALAALPVWWRDRRIGGAWLRFFLGAALAAALLVPLGAAFSGGFDAYRKFGENTLKHKETPLTNHMGLRTLVAYRPAEAGRLLNDDKKTDPWLAWKNARLAAFARSKPVYYVLVCAFLALLALAVRGREPWIAAALGIAFIPVGVELTCYYYAFLAGIALLHQKNEKVGLWLLAAAAFTQCVDWHPLAGMPTWRDEQYTLMSAATLAGLLAIVAMFARSSRDHAQIEEFDYL